MSKAATTMRYRCAWSKRKSWSRGRAQAVLGDCMDVLRSIPASSVDVVLADPPYGISYHTKSRPKIINDERPFIWWLRDAFRVTKDTGCILCFCRWDVAEDYRWTLELAGFRVRSQVIWDRKVHGQGDTKTTFSPRHDIVWFATKGRFTFRGKRPASVIPVQRLPGTMRHPTEKPVPLFVELLKSVTRPNGLVLDPFMGTGTTGEACHELGLRFLGIEQDATYFHIAEKRSSSVCAAY